MATDTQIERRTTVSIVIPASASTSGNYYLGSNMVLCGLEIPATFTANTARLLIKGHFSEGGATSGTSFRPEEYDSSNTSESMITVAATNTTRVVVLSADKWESMNVISIDTLQSDESTAQAQAAARTITAIVRPY